VAETQAALEAARREQRLQEEEREKADLAARRLKV
jgi:hypothetical protein